MPGFVHNAPGITIYRAALAPASSGDNTLVAAVAATKIRVMAYSLWGASAVNAKFTSSTTSDLTKLHYMASGELGKVFPWNPGGWFETVAGELLGLNLSGAVVCSTQLTYILV